MRAVQRCLKDIASEALSARHPHLPSADIVAAFAGVLTRPMLSVAVKAAFRPAEVIAVMRVDERRMTNFLLRLRIHEHRFEIQPLRRFDNGILLMAGKAGRRFGRLDGRTCAAAVACRTSHAVGRMLGCEVRCRCIQGESCAGSQSRASTKECRDSLVHRVLQSAHQRDAFFSCAASSPAIRPKTAQAGIEQAVMRSAP